MLYDVVILGSGLSSLNAARYVDKGLKVLIITKTKASMGASVLAQGGIAAVSPYNKSDSLDLHVRDTIEAGMGLCKKDVVEYCVRRGPEVIKDLISIGVDFSIRDMDHNYDLTKEGGHSHRRVYHSGDTTGEGMVEKLLASVKSMSNVDILEDHVAINLIKDGEERVVGVYVLDIKSGIVKRFLSRALILASGGAGKVYLYTSNPDEATGDGIAMAYRAGAKIANMEFFQFHPTCLYHQDAKNFLISEALRGEGAVLRSRDGERFMERYHPRMELAPRDIVARAIDAEMKKTGEDCVFLDATDMDKNYVRKRFPHIYERCLGYGFDMTRQWLPVVPAAHYCCGGVLVDMKGKTSLEGLWACGEVTYTGFHGANRLASNSLLEAMVFSTDIGRNVASELIDIPDASEIPEWESSWAKEPEETILIHGNWDELRLTMWNNVGIVKSRDRLKNALKRIRIIEEETKSYYWKYELSKDLIELRNIVTVASLIVRSAFKRRESRGVHYIKDFPKINKVFTKDTIILKRKTRPRSASYKKVTIGFLINL